MVPVALYVVCVALNAAVSGAYIAEQKPWLALFYALVAGMWFIGTCFMARAAITNAHTDGFLDGRSL